MIYINFNFPDPDPAGGNEILEAVPEGIWDGDILQSHHDPADRVILRMVTIKTLNVTEVARGGCLAQAVRGFVLPRHTCLEASN